jgi:hypothetical protein
VNIELSPRELAQSSKGHRRFQLVKYATLVVLLVVLGFRASRLLHLRSVPVTDFAAFWAAARLQLKGEDPYSPALLWELQKSIGGTEFLPFLNPPWAMPLLMPFGLLDYPIARVIFLLVSLSLIFLSADHLWAIYGGPHHLRWVPPVVIVTCFPVLLALKLGQMGALILFGATGFLHFANRGQWLAAGAFTSLLSLKPHTAYLFWPAAVLWAFRKRQFGFFFGAAVPILLASLVSLAVNPSIFQDFFQFSRSLDQAVYRHSNPTIGALLRVVFGLDKRVLQFVSMMLGCVWFAFRWLQRRKEWDWKDELPLFLLVSLLTSSYVWVHDQVLLLVPILQAVIALQGSRARRILGFFLAYLLINGIALAQNLLEFGDLWFVWTMAAWVSLYWAVFAKSQK